MAGIRATVTVGRVQTGRVHQEGRIGLPSALALYIAAVLGTGVLALPGLRDLFRFSGLQPADSVLGISAGLASLGALDLFDRLRRRRRASSPL